MREHSRKTAWVFWAGLVVFLAASSLRGETPAATASIEIRSDKPVPVNPRIYGINCEEMLVKDMVDEPEYIAAMVELKLKTFLYPGGSISYYHHPQGTGGFNIRPEEVRRSKQGEKSRFMKEGSGPDHFEQYIRLVKASDGAALFVANVLNGTVDELDEFLWRLKAAQVPIAGVVLGVEMHLGQGVALGLDGYVDRIQPYITMLKAKYPEVPIIAHSTPVGRAGERRSTESFHTWNQRLASLPGIVGFSQYGWPEFGGQQRLQTLRSGLTAQTPREIWLQYDEFTRTFPQRQISAYTKDWGRDKKMYMTQWGTHADRNTAVQGMHIANFYFFMTQYNATHDNYFAAATGALILAAKTGQGMGRLGGVPYREKIVLLATYLYSKPFRHLFSGDNQLLTASISKENGNIKILAAAGPDGHKYIYLLNSGPAVSLGPVIVDGKEVATDSRVTIESAFGSDSASAIKTFVGEKTLRDLVLEPWSLTLVILSPMVQ